MHAPAPNVRLNPPEPGLDGPRYPPKRGPSLSRFPRGESSRKRHPVGRIMAAPLQP
jgi:hypothetical protein